MQIKIFSLLLLISTPLLADRGSIPISPHVEVFEPAQRAIIAWNGNEELLILSTDMNASDSTKVLEILPLPSEPTVKKGTFGVFSKTDKFINDRLSRDQGESARQTFSKGGGDYSEHKKQAGEITFHKTIGSHDISVAHVLIEKDFFEWVEKYLNKLNIQNPSIPEPMKKVIQEYLAGNFAWFVFDIISLGKSLRTNEPLQYRFKTDEVYYPLRITKAEMGETEIKIVVFSNKMLNINEHESYPYVKLLHMPLYTSLSELNSIDTTISHFLGNPDTTVIRTWVIKASLSSFGKDLIAK
jgi:hypothetical protein